MTCFLIMKPLKANHSSDFNLLLLSSGVLQICYAVNAMEASYTVL